MERKEEENREITTLAFLPIHVRFPFIIKINYEKNLFSYWRANSHLLLVPV
jgi:hypothetical protein